MQPCFEVVNIFINLLLWNVDGDISDLQFGVLGFWKNLTLSVERSFGAKPPFVNLFFKTKTKKIALVQYQK